MRNFVFLLLATVALPGLASASQLICKVDNALTGPSGQVENLTLSAEIATHVKLVNVAIILSDTTLVLTRDIVNGRVNWQTYERSFSLGRVNFSDDSLFVIFPGEFSSDRPHNEFLALITIVSGAGSRRSHSAKCETH